MAFSLVIVVAVALAPAALAPASRAAALAQTGFEAAKLLSANQYATAIGGPVTSTFDRGSVPLRGGGEISVVQIDAESGARFVVTLYSLPSSKAAADLYGRYAASGTAVQRAAQVAVVETTTTPAYLLKLEQAKISGGDPKTLVIAFQAIAQAKLLPVIQGAMSGAPAKAGFVALGTFAIDPCLLTAAQARSALGVPVTIQRNLLGTAPPMTCLYSIGTSGEGVEVTILNEAQANASGDTGDLEAQFQADLQAARRKGPVDDLGGSGGAQSFSGGDVIFEGFMASIEPPTPKASGWKKAGKILRKIVVSPYAKVKDTARRAFRDADQRAWDKAVKNPLQGAF